MIGATIELDCSSAYISLREPGKSKDKAEKEVDLEECHSAVEADLLIAKKRTQMQGNGYSNKHPPSLSDVRRLRYWRKARSFPLSKGSARINKDQHNSAVLTPESIIGELEQYSGSMFNYSTTAVESNWEPRGMLQSE
ncbi:hypothetical protein BHM03_00035598 [Ensete ventricosum]|nr:hypothetical protein BHM03_00035598 [Ensete ventricosum]